MSDTYRYNPVTNQLDLVDPGSDYARVLAELADLRARQAVLEEMMANTPYLNWEYIQTTLEWETLEDVADLSDQ